MKSSSNLLTTCAEGSSGESSAGLLTAEDRSGVFNRLRCEARSRSASGVEGADLGEGGTGVFVACANEVSIAGREFDEDEDEYLEPKKVKKVKLEPPVEFEVPYSLPESPPWLKIHLSHPCCPEVEP